MKSRAHNLRLLVDGEELAKAHALAEAGDEPISMMIRRMIAERYAKRFGDVPPPAPRLKHRPR